jgi:hypothetical protein
MDLGPLSDVVCHWLLPVEMGRQQIGLCQCQLASVVEKILFLTFSSNEPNSQVEVGVSLYQLGAMNDCVQ